MKPTLTRSLGLITGVALALVGLYLAIAGGQLAFLGGSLFYLFAGLVLIVTGVLGVVRPKAAPLVYAALMLVTLVWALAETGLNIWGLEVRLITFLVFGVWLLVPAVWATGRGWMADKAALLGSVAVTGVVLLASCFTSYSINGTLSPRAYGCE